MDNFIYKFTTLKTRLLLNLLLLILITVSSINLLLSNGPIWVSLLFLVFGIAALILNTIVIVYIQRKAPK